MAEKFAIRTRRSTKYDWRYVSHCDNNWYETTTVPLYRFTSDEINEVTEQLKRHYQYYIEVVNQDNEVIEIVNWCNKKGTTHIKPNVHTSVKERKPITKPTIAFNKELMLKRMKKLNLFNT